MSAALRLQLTLVTCYLPYTRNTVLSCWAIFCFSGFVLLASTLVSLNSSLNLILYCWKIAELRRARCHFPFHMRNIMTEHGLFKVLTSILSTQWPWRALALDIMPDQKRDTLALRMQEPTPKCVLWIFSSIAGLIELGITACWPLYTMPSAKESSSLKV